MNLLLDTGILGQLCHPRQQQNRPVSMWLTMMLERATDQNRIFLPEVADYELRRKLLHLASRDPAQHKGIDRLNNLGALLHYLPINTEVMRAAAELWAEARRSGFPTAHDHAIDGDMILASQARSIGGTIVTMNRKHLAPFAPVLDWANMPAERS